MKSSLKHLTALLQQAVSDHFFSGASLLIFYQGDILFQEKVGYTSWRIGGLEPRPVESGSLFDLASLTKPLATVFLTALLNQEKKISLNNRAGDFLDSSLSEEIKNATLRALLNHSAGFPDWKPYFSDLFPEGSPRDVLTQKRGKSLVYQKVHHEPFVYPQGEKNIYSDLGFVLLGEILENKGGNTLDQLFIRNVTEPLGIKDLGYIPLNPFDGVKTPHPFGERRSFVATEKSEFRHKIILGEVHDDNAYVMGGVAGHAGLFGTAESVYACFSEWRNGYGRKGKLLSHSSVKEFTERERFPADWGLGWMFPSVPSSAGAHFSRSSFGHLGFTGTSIWYDPQSDLGVIFLSNRVHPTRENNCLREFRPLLHDLIYQAVIHEKT